MNIRIYIIFFCSSMRKMEKDDDEYFPIINCTNFS